MAMLRAVKERFGMKLLCAIEKFNEGGLDLKDVFDDDSAIETFFIRKMRYARAIGILALDDRNWHAVATIIQGKMSFSVRYMLCKPRANEFLEDYFQEIEEARDIFTDEANEKWGKKRIYI